MAVLRALISAPATTAPLVSVITPLDFGIRRLCLHLRAGHHEPRAVRSRPSRTKAAVRLLSTLNFSRPKPPRLSGTGESRRIPAAEEPLIVPDKTTVYAGLEIFLLFYCFSRKRRLRERVEPVSFCTLPTNSLPFSVAGSVRVKRWSAATSPRDCSLPEGQRISTLRAEAFAQSEMHGQITGGGITHAA